MSRTKFPRMTKRLPQVRGPWFAPDHAAFEQLRLNAENVIDSKSVEGIEAKKPGSVFSYRAAAAPRQFELVATPEGFSVDHTQKSRLAA
jgi:hypothetical protein